MAQTYTLEEAAKRLGITPSVLKQRLNTDWKSVRTFRDGPTMRLRTTDVDELARSLGEVSDPSLQLAPLSLGDMSSGDFQVPEVKKPAPPPADEPIIFDLSSSESISLDDPAPGSAKGDSDVRLDSTPPKSRNTPNSNVGTDDDIEIDLAGPGSAIIREGSAARLTGAPKSSTKLSASDSNKQINKPNLAESSEFELSLDSDSDDFELQINQDSSDDEVVIGDIPTRKPGDSGINLRDPKDSGINLEKQGPKSSIKPTSGIKIGKSRPPEPDESDLDFELSLEPPVSASPHPGKSGRLPPISDSDSEFELSLEDPSSGSVDSLMHAALPDEDKNNIFETDFEIPPLDESSSEAKALADSDGDSDSDSDSDSNSENSDFDLALDSSDIEVEDESASQVVLLEDESEEAKPLTSARRKSRAVEEEEEDVELEASEEDVEVEDEESDVAGALQGVRGKSRYDEDEEDEEEADEDEEVVRAAPAPTSWGVLPAIFLAPAFAVMLLGGLIGYEMLQSMWGYHQTRSPGTPIVRGVADAFGMDIKDQ